MNGEKIQTAEQFDEFVSSVLAGVAEVRKARESGGKWSDILETLGSMSDDMHDLEVFATYTAMKAGELE